jgi:hypothetical protein
MAPGGFFIADRRAGPGFLQLAMHNIGESSYTVEFGLPEIGWSSAHFDELRDALHENGFAPTVELGEGPVARFMRVLIEGSESSVIARVTTLFEITARCLHWDPDTTFNVRFGGPIDHPRIRAGLQALKRRGA